MPNGAVEQAVEQANDAGLASYIQAKDIQKARDMAAYMRSGNVYINYPARDAGLSLRRLQVVRQRPRTCRVWARGFPEIKGIARYEAAE